MNFCYLLLGTNIGKREYFLEKARKKIEEHIGIILASSPVYESEPWGCNDQNNFLNQVVHCSTIHTPTDLLTILLSVEEVIGRKRTSVKYAPRKIDIDILFYNSEIINKEYLIIPHPLLHKRKFALRPIADIAPEYIHPVLKKKISVLLSECTDQGWIEKYNPEINRERLHPEN